MRRPQQSRSQDTFKTILDATERVLVGEGAGSVTTTRIAKVAGVGVGTLYQYFPDRRALLRGVERRAWEDVFAKLQELLPAVVAAGRPTERAALRALVEASIGAIGESVKRHGASLEDPDMRAVVFELWDETVTVVQGAFVPLLKNMRRPDVALALRIVISTVSLQSWVASVRGPQWSGGDAWTQEVSDMMLRYFFDDDLI
jgi:AcrR family transcriptional regulator